MKSSLLQLGAVNNCVRPLKGSSPLAMGCGYLNPISMGGGKSLYYGVCAARCGMLLPVLYVCVCRHPHPAVSCATQRRNAGCLHPVLRVFLAKHLVWRETAKFAVKCRNMFFILFIFTLKDVCKLCRYHWYQLRGCSIGMLCSYCLLIGSPCVFPCYFISPD